LGSEAAGIFIWIYSWTGSCKSTGSGSLHIISYVPWCVTANFMFLFYQHPPIYSVFLKCLAKLCELTLRIKKDCIDIGPEMLPIWVITLQICTPEKVFKVASLRTDHILDCWTCLKSPGVFSTVWQPSTIWSWRICTLETGVSQTSCLRYPQRKKILRTWRPDSMQAMQLVSLYQSNGQGTSC
jgi:hypothetical protein